MLRGPSVVNITAVAEGVQHNLNVLAAVTADWQPGLYEYTARVSNGTDFHEVESGQITLTPDLASAVEGHDGRSHAKRTLDAIEAVIEKRASLDQERYRINNRELYRTPIADLLKLRDLYRMEVRREQGAARGKNPFSATVRVRLR